MNEQALKTRLQAIAREKALPVNACWKRLILERVLARIARSPHTERLIFKGGFLLSYLIGIGRETTDLDFLLTKVEAEIDNVRLMFEEIASIFSHDGFAFSLGAIEMLSQPHMSYPGYRITLNASFQKMKDRVCVDVGVGDLVEPAQFQIKLAQYKDEPLFEDSISLLVYPIETIFAEKLETALSKGSANSRMKDYHDLLLLSRRRDLLESETLSEAVAKTFEHRGTALMLLEFDAQGIQGLQKLWTSHLRGLGDVAKDLNLPTDITVVIKEINSTTESILV